MNFAHLNAALSESATEWGVSTRLARWIFWIPPVGAIAMAAARVNKHLFRLLLADDGVVEWAQFVLFVLACLAATGVATRLFALRKTWQGLSYAAFAFALFFISGEEIAWGQRLLGLTTPDRLSNINAQHEITVHNIGRIQDASNIAMLLGSGLAIVVFMLSKQMRFERYSEHANHLFVPPLFLLPALFLVFLYKVVRFTVWPEPGFTITKYAEWIEFCLALVFCVVASLNFRRLTLDSRPTPENTVVTTVH